MSKESRRDNKRLSRIIKVDFGKEVGISLDELETEFDDLINELELQEPIPEEIEETKEEENMIEVKRKDPADIHGSMTSLNKKTAKIKDMFARAHRMRASSTGGTTVSHLQAHSGRIPIANFTASETCSLDLDADVFFSSADENSREGSICSESNYKGKNRTISWLNKKFPITAGKHDGTEKRRTSDHMLIPPVLVDGAVTSNYQYMTPIITVETSKASTLSRLIKRSSPEHHGKKKEISLKDMYNATVKGPCA